MDRAHKHVLPDTRGHGRHQEERGDDHDTDQPLAEHGFAEQQGRTKPPDHSQTPHATHKNKSVVDRIAKTGVGQEPVVVVPTGTRRRAGLQGSPNPATRTSLCLLPASALCYAVMCRTCRFLDR